MAVGESERWITNLEGTGLAIVVVSLVGGTISLIVVALRAMVRLRENVFGWDDGLMVGGLLIYLVEVGLACTGANRGLGKYNVDLNDFMQVEATKYLMIWMLMYICSLVLIKSSICVTMLRIAGPNKVYRISIWVLLSIIIATYLTTFIGVLLLCSPVEANWDTALVTEGKARCAGMSAMIGLSYTSTAASIATDMACAVLPGIILWRTQMKLKDKISVSILLSFGSFASISTMIRTPYIEYYRTPSNNLVAHVANIVLWSNVESAIGLMAGSLPSLRRLIMRRVQKSSADSSGPFHDNPVSLVTFGGTALRANQRKSKSRRERTFKSNTEGGVSIATVHARSNENWKRLPDESDKDDSVNGIRAEYTYEVELSRPAESQSLGSNV